MRSAGRGAAHPPAAARVIGKHIRFQGGRQIRQDPSAVSALAIGVVPAFPALRAAATSAGPQIDGGAFRKTQLAFAGRHPLSKLSVPPTSFGGEDGNRVIGAQAAPAAVESPAFSFTHEQTAAGALEGHRSAQALAAKLAGARVSAPGGSNSQRNGGGTKRAEPLPRQRLRHSE